MLWVDVFWSEVQLDVSNRNDECDAAAVSEDVLTLILDVLLLLLLCLLQDVVMRSYIVVVS